MKGYNNIGFDAPDRMISENGIMDLPMYFLGHFFMYIYGEQRETTFSISYNGKEKVNIQSLFNVESGTGIRLSWNLEKKLYGDMKAEELMLGDWVLDERENEPRRVQRIEKEWIDIHGNSLTPIRHIRPVPLTDEMLEINKIAFEFYDGYHFEMEKGMLTVNVGGIWFVHELQHALRLCGLDGMAETFKI